MVKSPTAIFGTNLKKYRLQAGLSQEALAELCGLHRTYVGAVERGERTVSLMNIVAIARALGVLPAKLLEGIE